MSQTIFMRIWDKHDEELARLEREGWKILKKTIRFVLGNGSKPMIEVTARRTTGLEELERRRKAAGLL